MRDRDTDAMLLSLRTPRRVRPHSFRPAPLHRRLRTDNVTDTEIADFHHRLMLRFTNALDSSSLEAGPQQIWNSSGGTSSTPWLITCTSLAAATGSSTTGVRQGAKLTNTTGVGTSGLVGTPSSPWALTNSPMPELLTCSLKVQTTSAPTAGDHVDLYLAFSDSSTAGTDNPGGVTGVDGAGPNFTALGMLTLALGVPLSADIGTGVQQVWGVPIAPQDAYVSPVIVNNASVALDATAAHTNLVITPWYRVRQV